MTLLRQAVFDAINGERSYQDGHWTPEITTSGGRHSIGEWVVFIDDYVRQVKTELSRNPEPTCSDLALHTIRKIAALAVACMEQNGVRHRTPALPPTFVERPGCRTCGFEFIRLPSGRLMVQHAFGCPEASA